MLDNLPYSGQNGLEYIARRGLFSTPFVIKMLAVNDMSKPVKNTFTDFDSLVYNVRTSLHQGDKVRATVVVENKDVDGFVDNIKVDYDNQRVRIFVRKKDCNDVVEVYPESVYRDLSIRESASYVMSLSEFVEKTSGRQ